MVSMRADDENDDALAKKNLKKEIMKLRKKKGENITVSSRDTVATRGTRPRIALRTGVAVPA